ncbi:MAG: hypothetical protein ACLGIN_15595 [Candidatus Sericytochromatia bacterium]
MLNHFPCNPGAAGCRVTLTLPTSVVQAVLRLAELTGERFNDELLRVAALYLDAWRSVGDELDHLFALDREDVPWEAVTLTLPGWALTAIFELSERHDATPDQALAIMLRGTAKTLVRVEGLALGERKRFPEAFLEMIARDVA